MISAVLILPAAYRDAGDALAVAHGWASGPGTYIRALRPIGSTGPATHYGCRPDVSQSFVDLLAAPPSEAAPLIAALIADFDGASDGASHFARVMAERGLEFVPEDNT